jgi:hypothetical protein
MQKIDKPHLNSNYGPGGRKCFCCGPKPGKTRKASDRTAKRRNKQRVRKELRAFIG